MTTILGIAANYHDSAAAILVDGIVVAAAQEERFSRIKHDASFPNAAIHFCLDAAQVKHQGIDYVAYYEKPLRRFERLLDSFASTAPKGFPLFRNAIPAWTQRKLHIDRTIGSQLQRVCPRRTLFVEHHQSHAAAAFYNSPFREAAVMIVDGVGEWATATIGNAKENRLRLEHEMRFPHSLGLLYSAFTSYLGFRVNDGEYKVMGLASYGKPQFKDIILDELIDLKSDGSFRLNMKHFGFCTHLSMFNPSFESVMGGRHRHAGEPLNQRHSDIAASIQAATEEILLRMARFAYKQSNCDCLVFGGGVALNCVANSTLATSGPFKSISVYGAAGDAGAALGAAQFVWYQLLGNHKHGSPSGSGVQQGVSSLMLGPSYDDQSIRLLLVELGVRYREYNSFKELCSAAAVQLADQKVLGWFQGPMEFGPRALGGRSILADPRSPVMQDILNSKIKERESFRPFAPAVLQESADEFFCLPSGVDCSTMAFTGWARSKPSPRNTTDAQQSISEAMPVSFASRQRVDTAIPAVTHVDQSSRVQTVSKVGNPLFYQLISSFRDLTGCPLLINTSFNGANAPIVCSPRDAVACFQSIGLDALVIGKFLIIRDEQDWLTRFDLAISPAADPFATARHPDVAKSHEHLPRVVHAARLAIGAVTSAIAAALQRVAVLLSQLLANVALALAYFLVFSGVGFVRRAFRKRAGELEEGESQVSFWQVKRDTDSLKSYFRQS